MTPEECANCPYFDGFDTCELSFVKLPIGKAVFPVPISIITECKRKEAAE